MKRIFTLVGILLLASCTKDEMFLEIEEQIQNQQIDIVEPIPPTQSRTFTLYKESVLNKRSGISFNWYSSGHFEYSCIIDNDKWYSEEFHQGSYGGGHAYGDVNGDGYQDILLSHHVTDKQWRLAWYINQGDNRNYHSTTQYFNQSTDGLDGHKILKTDVNNDGLADYIALGVDERIEGNYTGNFTVLIQKSDGKFDIKHIPNPNRYWFHNGAAGDLNGDGNVDVITATFIWWGDGTGNFTRGKAIDSDLNYIKSPLNYEILDMNKDGWNDMILRGPHDARMCIVINNNGVFDNNNKLVFLPTPDFPHNYDIEIVDFDKDGDYDIVELANASDSHQTHPYRSRLNLYYNDNLSFKLNTDLLSESLDGNYLNGSKDQYSWSRLKFDDIDGDGQDEIIAENYHDGDYNALKKINGVWKKVSLKFSK